MVSVIIPFRFENKERLECLGYILDCYSSYKTNIELILIEQDVEPKLPERYKKNIIYFYIKHTGLFNRSWAFNVGACNATFSKIVFSDADIILNEVDFEEALKCLDFFDAVNPYSSIVDLSPSQTDRLFASQTSLSNIILDEKLTLREGINFSGGILLMRINSFFQINGWPEEIWGWGMEDSIMSLKIERNLKFREMRSTAYHLYHPPTTMKQHRYTEVNRHIFSTYLAYSNQRRIFWTPKKIGDPKKYRGFFSLVNIFIFHIKYRRQISSHYHYLLKKSESNNWLPAALLGLVYNPFSLSLISTLLKKLFLLGK